MIFMQSFDFAAEVVEAEVEVLYVVEQVCKYLDGIEVFLRSRLKVVEGHRVVADVENPFEECGFFELLLVLAPVVDIDGLCVIVAKVGKVKLRNGEDRAVNEDVAVKRLGFVSGGVSKGDKGEEGVRGLDQRGGEGSKVVELLAGHFKEEVFG